MKSRYLMLGSTCLAAMLSAVNPAVAQEATGALPSGASQQTAPVVGEDKSDTGVTDQDIVVTGLRASLQSAQAIKRNSTEIVDSIVAEDIGKLPDINVAEALQRITGVQISRSAGEGTGIAIRGLTQVRTELNGRSVFTSGGRSISLEDVPSELLAAADVYKSSSANQIEGGIGGLVNLRLRKPLDFSGLEVAGQIRATYYDYAEKTKPQVSGLVSNRWSTGIGEMGLLLAGAYQRTAFRSDSAAAEPYNLRTDFFDLNGNGRIGDAADAILVPGGGGLGRDIGSRTRYGANAAFQWRPSDTLEVNLDGLYQRFAYRQDSDLLYIFGDSSNADAIKPGAAATVYDGTNTFRSGTFANINTVVGPYTSDRTSTTWQAAGNVKYHAGPATLTADVAYTKATSKNDFLQLRINGNSPTLFMDTSTRIPTLRPGGIDLTNSANFKFESAAQYYGENSGDEIAAQVDGVFDIESAFLKKMSFGVRYADRTTQDGSAYVYTDLTQFPQSALPAAFGTVVTLNQFGKGGYDTASIPQRFVTPPVSLVRDFEKIRSALGIASGPPAPTPLSTYDLSERTLAAYVMGNYEFAIGGIEASGNAGVRIINTDTATKGNQVTPAGGTAPLSVGGSYVSVLPSMNIRLDFTRRLTLRAAASKGLSRADFGNLSPSLFLDYLFKTGNAGNPNLGPLKSDQYDISLEYYMSPTNLLYVAGFAKNVQGFITNVVAPETINGQIFQIRRPQNGDDGKIRGFEVGWNQFLDFLPSPFDGFGYQLNYTYVNSKAPGPLVGQVVPLEGLSKNSYNIIGLYEKGPVSLRVAYNWRDSYVLTTAGAGSGSNPVYSKGGGFLDASVSVEVVKNITVFAYGANLLRTAEASYFGDENRRRDFRITDRRLTGGVRFRF